MYILLDRKEIEQLHSCHLCPRECGADRLNGEIGYCGMTSVLRAGLAYLHMWEEPVISGERGSGTVFFSGCNMKCRYCQNADISFNGAGKDISDDRLSVIFMELQEKGAHNINLVTPTHYVPQIAGALRAAKAAGLHIPVVYNSSAYENVSTLRMLDGLVDVFLPDLKYYDTELSAKLSDAPDYFVNAAKAVAEMVKQQPEVIPDEDGIMLKGVIVRHLVLPGHSDDSKRILEHLAASYGNNVWLSLMDQYTPLRPISKMAEMSRRVSYDEYDDLVGYALSLGLDKGFIQEGGAAEDSFIPLFNGEGI